MKQTSDHREITNIICEYFDIKKEDLFVRNRKRELVTIRQFNYYMIRKFTSLSFIEIGKETTGSEYDFKQDHATVIHAVNTISGLRRFNKDIESKCISLELLISQFIDTGDIEYLKVLLIQKIKYACNLDDLIKVIEGQKSLLENQFKN